MSAAETPLFEFAYDFTKKIGDEFEASGHPPGYLGKLLVVAQTGDGAAVARLMQEIEDLIRKPKYERV